MTLPSGTISFSDLQTKLVGTEGAVALSQYYAGAPGIPASGALALGAYRGKSRQGLGTTSMSTPGSMYGWCFAVTGTASADATINFWDRENGQMLWHLNLRVSASWNNGDGVFVENSHIGGAWRTQIDTPVSTIGIVKNAPYNYFVKLTSSVFTLYKADGTLVRSYNNYLPATAITYANCLGASMERVIKIWPLVPPPVSGMKAQDGRVGTIVNSVSTWYAAHGSMNAVFRVACTNGPSIVPTASNMYMSVRSSYYTMPMVYVEFSTDFTGHVLLQRSNNGGADPYRTVSTKVVKNVRSIMFHASETGG